jgi:hypothetical protein
MAAPFRIELRAVSLAVEPGGGQTATTTLGAAPQALEQVSAIRHGPEEPDPLVVAQPPEPQHPHGTVLGPDAA